MTSKMVRPDAFLILEDLSVMEQKQKIGLMKAYLVEESALDFLSSASDMLPKYVSEIDMKQ